MPKLIANRQFNDQAGKLLPVLLIVLGLALSLPRPASAEPIDGFTEPFRTIDVASVEERVIDIVAEQLGVSKEQVTRDTSFVNDLGADSLDTVELVMELEEEFDITIPDDAAEKIQTFGQAIEYIDANTQQ